MKIRNSIKAIILDGDKILLTKNQDEEGYFYLCPGGGQEHGETFHSALKRECVEEIGSDVDIQELLHIREYVGKNHEYAETDLDVHQVEFYFLCHLNKSENQTTPINPDSYQVGVEWVSIEELLNYRFYPMELRKYIIGYFKGEKSTVYLGDMN